MVSPVCPVTNMNRMNQQIPLPGEELPPSTLQLVEIYFDTATFDDIERDRKIKTEAQLSLIGGTMGLLTGFSIISGVEILYFAAKIIYKMFKDKKIVNAE